MARPVQPDEQRLFRDHVKELRWRLIWWVLSVALFSGVAFFYHHQLESLITRPLHSKLYYTSPAGGVGFLFKLVLGFGLIPSLPILIYQLLRFLEPALPETLRRSLAKIIFGSIGLTLISLLFAYIVGLPIIFHFFSVFTNPNVQELITTNEYLSFIIGYLLTYAIFFQLPLVLVLVNKVFPITPKKLNRYQIYIVVAIFLISGIVTPTFDPVSQLVMAAPVIGIFELAVISISLTNRKRRRAETKNQNDSSSDGTGSLIAAERRYQDKDYVQARAIYEQLRQVDPHNAEIFSGLGKIAIREQQFAEAATLFEQAIAQNTQVASYHANLGIARLSLGQNAAATQAFGVALRLRPGYRKYQELLELSQR